MSKTSHTRDDVIRIVVAARATGTRPDLSGLDLSWLDLSGANLYEANLTGATLYEANLTGANLYEANLTGANLTGANLTGATLFRANLTEANLTRANLTNTRGGILRVDGLPSGQLTLVPTPVGWGLSIGCWKHHTLHELRDMTAGKIPLPSGASGAIRDQRLRTLATIADLCDAHTQVHERYLRKVQETWPVDSVEQT